MSSLQHSHIGFPRPTSRTSCRSGGSMLLCVLLCLVQSTQAHATPAAGRAGMVTTAHPLASEAGVAMLRAGGNAADAAAAAAFTLAVVEPYSSGLGGGGFALCRFGSKSELLDFREVAPGASRRDMFVKEGEAVAELSRDGALAVGVPGAAAGYLSLHERFGRLPRAAVLAPAIRAAEVGFRIEEPYREAVNARLQLLRQDPEASRVFLSGTGKSRHAPALGATLVQPELAWTLRQIAAHGADAFYRGVIAERLIEDMQQRGGIITRRDLERFEVRVRRPLEGTFLGHRILTTPPPSAGGQVLLTILGVIEAAAEPIRWHDPRFLHLFIEASKRAFADRQLIGDPAFVPDLTDRLVAKDRTELLAKVIELEQKATPSADIPAGQGAQLPLPHEIHHSAVQEESPHTTHLCVLDDEGNAVSMTTTINYLWGAGIVASGTGIVWNDEMDDFSAAPGAPNVFGVVGNEANAVAPGKIPVSSMSPTLVLESESSTSPVRMLVGSPGGPRIPTTVLQVIVNHLMLGADIEQALSFGRIHHQHLPDVTRVERFTLDPLTKEWLERRGHHLQVERPWSNANAISVDPKTGIRHGAADPRGVGVAIAE